MAAEKVSRARSFFLLETTSLGGRRSVQRKREPSLSFPGLLRQQILMNVWQDSSARNSHASQKFPQLLIVPHCKLYVPRDNPILLVVPGRISSKLQNLGCEVFEDGGEVDRRARSNALCVSALFEEPSYSTDGELEAGLLRS